MYGLVETLKCRKACKGMFAFFRKFLEEFMYFIWMFFMLIPSLKATVHVLKIRRKSFSAHYSLIFLP